jgi:hypothetical protein
MAIVNKIVVLYRDDQKKIVKRLKAKNELNDAFQLMLDCISEGIEGSSERFAKKYVKDSKDSLKQ